MKPNTETRVYSRRIFLRRWLCLVAKGACSKKRVLKPNPRVRVLNSLKKARSANLSHLGGQHEPDKIQAGYRIQVLYETLEALIRASANQRWTNGSR